MRAFWVLQSCHRAAVEWYFLLSCLPCGLTSSTGSLEFFSAALRLICGPFVSLDVYLFRAESLRRRDSRQWDEDPKSQSFPHMIDQQLSKMLMPWTPNYNDSHREGLHLKYFFITFFKNVFIVMLFITIGISWFTFFNPL